MTTRDMENAAARAYGSRNGYCIHGKFRVKHSDGFQYFLNNLEVNREYFDWFVTHETN